MNTCRLSTLLFSLSLAACTPKATSPETDAGTNGGTDGGTDAGLYAISTFVNTGGSQQSYLILTDDVTREQELGLDNAMELAGQSALAVGPAGSGRLFVTGNMTATLTRYDVGENDVLVKSEKALSFDAQGVTGQLGAYSAQYIFVSPTKAYYFDARTFKAVIWNPEAMEVTGTLELPALNLAGHAIQYSASPALRVGTKLYYGVGWLTADRLGVAKRSGMIVVDTVADTAKLVVDLRCAWAKDGVLGADGKIYLGTEPFGSAAYKLDSNRAGPLACSALIRRATASIPPSWSRWTT